MREQRGRGIVVRALRGLPVALAVAMLGLPMLPSESAASPPPANEIDSDFDGDGFDDVAIGAVSEDLPGKPNVGGVNVLYGTAGGLSAARDQFFTQDSANVGGGAETGDAFGFALATGDFNADGFDDLAIGVPAETVGGDPGGGVNVIYGSATGLSATTVPDQFWSQDSPDVEETTDDFDLFGRALAAGDFNNDGFADLAIGAPGEMYGIATSQAGGVNVLYGSEAGLDPSTVADQFWRQGVNGVGEFGEQYDAFGYALTAGDFNGTAGYDDLAIGAPGETLGNEDSAGVVHVIHGSSLGLRATGTPADQVWSQLSPEVFGSAEEGDVFGSALAAADFGGDSHKDLAIGVRGEDLGTVADAGGVTVLFGSTAGLSATTTPDQFWSQESSQVEDTPEEDDAFGTALAAADFGGGSKSDLAIGIPGENVGTVADAGAVAVLHGASGGLTATATPDQLWHQNSPDIFGSCETADAFGSALAAANLGGSSQADLVIGVRHESVGAVVGAGGITVIYGAPGGLSATVTPDDFWSQDSEGVNDASEPGDALGASTGAA